jgi:HD superfamily phosphodiesterase
MNNRIERMKKEIQKLHTQSKNECMRKWFYNGHVELVANYAKEIAHKVNADPKISILASLFHDITGTWEVTSDPMRVLKNLKK